MSTPEEEAAREALRRQQSQQRPERADPPSGPDRRDRQLAADVARAHAGARRAESPYAPRRPDGTRRPPRRPTPGQRMRRFTHRHGWRAYALPVLAVVTVVALLTSTSSAGGSSTGNPKPIGPSASVPRVAPSQLSLKDDSASGNVDNAVLKGYTLPAGGPYTRRGTGTFRILKGTTPVIGKGRLFRYSIDVENGMHDIDLTKFQKTVDTVLADRRSWSGHGVALKRVDSGPIDFHITLTTSMTVRKWCGYSIPVETSCYAAAYSQPVANVNRVIFNDARWVRGSTAYLGDVALYREYMVNHEDGHALGHEHAHACLDDGLAPAMMQQTFGLRSAVTKKLCQANPWPYPPGAKDAPGKEAQDTRHNDEFEIGD